MMLLCLTRKLHEDHFITPWCWYSSPHPSLFGTGFSTLAGKLFDLPLLMTLSVVTL